MSTHDNEKPPGSLPDPDAGDPPSGEQSSHKHTNSTSSMHNAKGWDGKLRVEKRAVLVNPEVLDGHVSDPEDSDDEEAIKVDQIEADEGNSLFALEGQKKLADSTCAL
jgi:protein phosphatase 1 regulatory subunit 7